MIEIDVTVYVEDHDCSLYSDSVFNSGLQNIGEITWRNACQQVTDEPLVTAEQQAELRDWLAGFGAWDREEIAAMTDVETNAMLLQFVAGDVQEMLDYDTDEGYRAACEYGTCSGRLYKSSDRWYFLVSN